jgi:hypothetical protein
MTGTSNETKNCGDCLKQYAKTPEFFYKTGKINKDGTPCLKSICKACHKNNTKKRYIINRENGVRYTSYTPNELRKEYFKKYRSDKAKMKKIRRRAYLNKKKKNGTITEEQIHELHELMKT